MKEYSDKRVINGTYGEAWFNSDYIAEVIGMTIKLAVEKADVKQCRKLMTGKKVIGLSGSGTVKMNKVTSRALNLYKNIKKGEVPDITLISNLSDPDAYGAERVKVTGVIFDEVTLADWEAGKLGEESIPFTFSDYDLIDTIKTQ